MENGVLTQLIISCVYQVLYDIIKLKFYDYLPLIDFILFVVSKSQAGWSELYLVAVLVLATALFVSVIVNICLCVKFKQSTDTSHDQGSAVDLSQSSQPIYETAAAVVETTTQEELEVDMEKNVAYAPIRRHASQI